MSNNRKPPVILFILFALLGLWPSLPAAGQDDSWRTLLRLQLQETFDCGLSEVLYHRTFPLGGSVALEGRARCIDQREYEFSRPREHMKFQLRLCQPAVC